MKKFAAAVMAAMLTVFVGAGSVLAAFPPIQFAKGETVSVKWNNLTEINTLTPGGVSFTVEVDSKSSSSSEYTVEYKIGDKPKATGKIDVPPASKKVQSFSTNLDAGIYDTSITVSKNGETLYSNEEQITVMQHYTGEWGDELTKRGFAAHVSKYNKEVGADKLPYYFTYSGAQGFRDGSNWEYMEKGTRGNLYWGGIDSDFGNLHKSGLKMCFLNGCGNGWLYLPERGMAPNAGWSVHTIGGRSIPQTAESIMAFSDFMVNMAKHLTETSDAYTMETWNEYNSVTSQRATELVAQTYTDSVRPIRIKMMLEDDKALDDFDISAFTIGMWNEHEYLDACMTFDFYPFFDRAAVHKYVTVGGFEQNQAYYNEVKKYVDFVTRWGGWKEVDDTETGFTNPVASTAFATYESADWEMPQLLTMSEYADLSWSYLYDLKNDGENPEYSEHSFGSLDYNWKPKPQYLSYTNFNNMTSGGMLMGQIDTGLPAGTKAFMYYKDGEPVIIAWANLPDNSDVEWNIGGNVKVYDNHGTLVTESTDKVTLNGSPVYIKNADRSYMTAAVKYDLVDKAAEFEKLYGDVLTSELKEKTKSVFDSAATKLSGTADENTAYEVYKSYMNLGNDIIAVGSNGEISERETSSMLYSLYNAVKRANRLYAATYTGEVPKQVEDGWTPRYNKVRNNLYDNVSMQQYTDAMLKYVRNHVNEAKELFDLGENPQKAGMIKAINELTNDMCEWYDNFSAYETVRNFALTIQTPYYDRSTYANTDVKTEVNLHNYGKKTFKGTITVTDEEGKLIYETTPLTVFPNGGYTKTQVTVNVPKPQDGSIAHLFLNYVDEAGNVLYSMPTDYVIKERFTVTPLPVTETIENFKSVKLEVDNVSDEDQKAFIEVESDGSFDFKGKQFEAVVPAKSSSVIEIPVVNVENSKFHFHSFSYKVTDEQGNVVANSDNVISFTTVVKAKTPIDLENFNGDISDWEDAYPIYINPPQKPTEKSSWQNANCSARAFAKWDEDNLYLLIDIYDNAYLQTYTGSSIWNGDCIQIGLDPNNDKKVGSYAADDYEFGMTVSPLGTETYFWYKPSSSAGQNGVVDWFKCIRNNDENFSRYLAVLDKSIISGVNLKEGSKFGMNYVINDNDILVRDNFFQFTKGLADVKDPSQWADFNFIGTENAELTDGRATSIFPLKAESKISE